MDEKKIFRTVEVDIELRRGDFGMARNLCVAAVADQFGLSLNYVSKRYVTNDPDELGEFWYFLAALVRGHERATAADIFNIASGDTTLQ